MALVTFYKMVTPTAPPVDLQNNQSTALGDNTYSNYTWYDKLIAGSSERLNRYKDYDIMDNDIDISVALDIMAEEISGNNVKGELPMKVEIIAGQEQYVSSSTVVTLNAAMRTWCNIHDWHSRLFNIARNTIKYGDTFYVRSNAHKKMIFVSPKNVTAARVRQDDITDVVGWQIRMENYANGNTTVSQPFANLGLTSHGIFQEIEAKDIVRFSLWSETDDEAPFGKSVLAPVYLTFKQKQLIENAIIIYRIERAPEKKVFKIDVGNTNPAQRIAIMEKIKSELKQKKVPSFSGGQSQMESVYNPLSQQQDYFFAMRPDGSGSTVEILPGGQNLGSLEDLMYFYNKIFRGMRIPKSFIDSTTEGGGIANDGKVGIAYLQEVKFSLYMERIQRSLERTFDQEFKKFLHDSNIEVDPSIFKVVLPPPSNYEASRKQMMDADLLSNFTTAAGIPQLSIRFAMRKYLQLTEAEMKENERMKRPELGLNINGDDRDLPKIYNPDQAELGGFEGGFGGGSGSFLGGPPAGNDGLDTGDSMEGGSMDTTLDTGNKPTAGAANSKTPVKTPTNTTKK